jgi:hypothetical protein
MQAERPRGRTGAISYGRPEFRLVVRIRQPGQSGQSAMGRNAPLVCICADAVPGLCENGRRTPDLHPNRGIERPDFGTCRATKTRKKFTTALALT